MTKNKFGKSVLKKSQVQTILTPAINYKNQMLLSPYKKLKPKDAKATEYFIPVEDYRSNVIIKTLVRKLNKSKRCYVQCPPRSYTGDLVGWWRIVIPNRDYYVFDSHGDWQKGSFYIKYSSDHGWTTSRGDPVILPIKFKNLRWTKLFRAVLEARLDDMLKLKPKEFIELNKALQFRFGVKNVTPDWPIFKLLNLKDPKAVRELIRAYVQIK